jgi:hypothetical protein
MENNSEQSVKMTPMTSVYRRLETYLILWRSSWWVPGGGMAGARWEVGKQNQSLAKKIIRLYQFLCDFFSAFIFPSEQGDELLIECSYQTLDRDSMTFVSVLSTMVTMP